MTFVQPSQKSITGSAIPFQSFRPSINWKINQLKNSTTPTTSRINVDAIIHITANTILTSAFILGERFVIVLSSKTK